MTEYTAESFRQKLLCAPIGERVVYHVGDLRRDQGDSVRFTLAEQKRIRSLARCALTLFEKGFIHLFQRRVDKGFEYLAVRR